jgi:hypothetical protein
MDESSSGFNAVRESDLSIGGADIYLAFIQRLHRASARLDPVHLRHLSCLPVSLRTQLNRFREPNALDMEPPSRYSYVSIIYSKGTIQEQIVSSDI